MPLLNPTDLTAIAAFALLTLSRTTHLRSFGSSLQAPGIEARPAVALVSTDAVTPSLLSILVIFAGATSDSLLESCLAWFRSEQAAWLEHLCCFPAVAAVAVAYVAISSAAVNLCGGGTCIPSR